MSDLNFIERSKLDKLFGMGGGYVLDFSNRTFQEFVAESVGRDIYEQRYDYASGSKANRLRAFWNGEANHLVGKLVSDLIEIAMEQSPHRGDEALIDECRRIAERLLQGAPVQAIDAISEDLNEKDFGVLVESIRTAIDANEPEAGLDRLHTFVTKFLRRLCRDRGIDVGKDKPLHSLLGEYIKRLKGEGAIETQMTERILKSTISAFEAFSTVRNDHSFAHDNPTLNYEESLLIFNQLTSAIRFIQALERKLGARREDDAVSAEYDTPF